MNPKTLARKKRDKRYQDILKLTKPIRDKVGAIPFRRAMAWYLKSLRKAKINHPEIHID